MGDLYIYRHRNTTPLPMLRQQTQRPVAAGCTHNPRCTAGSYNTRVSPHNAAHSLPTYLELVDAVDRVAELAL
jgi:hypothetical protein